MSEFELAIISAVIGAVSGAIVAGLLSIWAIKLGNKWNLESTNKTVEVSFKKVENLIVKQESIKAATEFRTAFTEEQRLLEKGKPSANWLEGTAFLIIKAAFVKHENARIMFEPFLTQNNLPRFKKAWEEYRCKEIEKEATDDDFFCYNSDPGDFEKEKEKRQLALKRINNLLEFTKIHK